MFSSITKINSSDAIGKSAIRTLYQYSVVVNRQLGAASILGKTIGGVGIVINTMLSSALGRSLESFGMRADTSIGMQQRLLRQLSTLMCLARC